MRFGPEPVGGAAGAVLAHSLRLGRATLKKGQVLRAAELVLIAAAGLREVTVARLEHGDVDENEAAGRVAGSLAAEGVRLGPAETGRVNLYAKRAGLVDFVPSGVDALNAVTEDVTLAVLPPLTPVEAGRMIGTVKIIPFAVPCRALELSVAAARRAQVSVRAFRPLSIRLIQTLDDGLKPSVVEKTSAVTAARVARFGGALAGEAHCPHSVDSLTETLSAALAARPDMLLVIGASAIVDRRDVIPAAIVRSGGQIVRLGMPVDPGNLILIAEIARTPVLGLPGCARSPARNGLDWVLERFSASLPVNHDSVGGMGVGGLLIGREEDKDYF